MNFQSANTHATAVSSHPGSVCDCECRTSMYLCIHTARSSSIKYRVVTRNSSARDLKQKLSSSSSSSSSYPLKDRQRPVTHNEGWGCGQRRGYVRLKCMHTSTAARAALIAARATSGGGNSSGKCVWHENSSHSMLTTFFSFLVLI